MIKMLDYQIWHKSNQFDNIEVGHSIRKQVFSYTVCIRIYVINFWKCNLMAIYQSVILVASIKQNKSPSNLTTKGTYQRIMGRTQNPDKSLKIKLGIYIAKIWYSEPCCTTEYPIITVTGHKHPGLYGQQHSVVPCHQNLYNCYMSLLMPPTQNGVH